MIRMRSVTNVKEWCHTRVVSVAVTFKEIGADVRCGGDDDYARVADFRGGRWGGISSVEKSVK